MIVASQQKYGLLRSARNDDVFSIKTTAYTAKYLFNKAPTRGEVILPKLIHRIYNLHMSVCERIPLFHLSPCGRGRRGAPGEGVFFDDEKSFLL
jgi:hypothetical protein